jgi:hypothetical protein
MLLGLRDSDAVGCMEHGLKRSSAAAASQLNPVNQVCRMAADMSGCFQSAALPPYRVDPIAASSPPFTAMVRGHFDATRLLLNVPCSAALFIV